MPADKSRLCLSSPQKPPFVHTLDLGLWARDSCSEVSPREKRPIETVEKSLGQFGREFWVNQSVSRRGMHDSWLIHFLGYIDYCMHGEKYRKEGPLWPFKTQNLEWRFIFLVSGQFWWIIRPQASDNSAETQFSSVKGNNTHNTQFIRLWKLSEMRYAKYSQNASYF